MKGFEPWPRGWEFRVLNTTVLNFDYEDKTFFARKQTKQSKEARDQACSIGHMDKPYLQ